VTITITATIHAAAQTEVTNEVFVHLDADHDGVNDTTISSGPVTFAVLPGVAVPMLDPWALAVLLLAVVGLAIKAMSGR
jgi:hypothetical protein